MNNSTDISLFKYLSQILIGLVIAFVAVYFYAYYIGDSLALPWHVNTSYFSKPLYLEYFQSRGETIGFYVDQYINWQQYSVGNMRLVAWPGWVLLISVILTLWVISTAVTYFSRFWYLVSMGVLILILMQMNLIELQLWGDYGTYLAMGLLILSTYFFHAIRPSSSLTLRLFGMGGIILVYLLLIYLFSETTHVALTVISHGLYAPIILTVLFLIFIAGENIYSILKVSTAKGGKGKQNLFHFIVFGLTYMTLIILFFLNRRGKIDFELSFISPYIILLVSAVSAFFSFEPRFENQKGLLPISILKQWVFPSMFLTTMALIVYARLTANDPLLDSLEYAIIITHLAIGAVYFVATFINFTPMILQNLDVSKVFYKPVAAPMFLMGFGSMVFITALVFYVNFYPYHQMRSGMYNVLGDLSEQKGEALLAEQYYKQAITYDFINFKSNFQVAKYEKQNNNPVKTIESLQNTFFKKASGKGYTTLGNYYNSKNQAFNTLFTLKEAKKDIESKEVNNNLAFTYRQFNYYDSAYLLLQENWKGEKDNLTKSNLLALSTELPELGSADSLIRTLFSEDTRAKANSQALANNNNLALDYKIEKAKDTFLLQDELFLLYNAGISPTSSGDSTLIDVIDYYLSSRYNTGLRSYLYVAKAIQLYKFGQINQAFQLLELLKFIDNGRAANYNFMLGVWALHQNQRLLSNDYLNLSAQQGFDQKEISRVQNAVLGTEIPVYQSPLGRDFELLKSQADSAQGLHLLEIIARSNAFDESLTLKSIEEMSKLGATQQSIYEILVESHRINKYSVPIFQEYILSAVNTGLSKYALAGLSELAGLMPQEAYVNFKSFVEQQIEERRNQVFR